MHRLGRLFRSITTVTVVAAGLMAISASPAMALSTTADSTWMANGRVYASVQLGNTLYIGGSFTRIEDSSAGTQSYAANNLAAIDITTGKGIPSFTPDVTSSGIAAVRSLALSPDHGSTLYVGGSFDAIDGQTRGNLGAVALGTGAVKPYAPVVTGGGTTVEVSAILAVGTKVYLGGKFSKVSGKVRKFLAATAPDGTLDNTWKPQGNDKVNCLSLAADGQSIFIGGNFETVNSVPRQSLARVTLDTGALLAWQLSADGELTHNRIHTIISTPSRVYLGAGAKGPNWVGAYDAANGNTVWKFETVGNVQALALSADGSRLYFGGHFGTGQLQQTVCGSKKLHGLAFIASPGTTGSHSPDCSWIPSIEPFGNNFQGVWTLGLTSSVLWIGGGFRTIGGIDNQNIARFTI